MRLKVIIEDRIAKYIPKDDDEIYVCGNLGDYIDFQFDAEWYDYQQKTARFVVNGKYQDVEFTGNTCEIPFLEDSNSFLVGVYVGEPEEDEIVLSTTSAEVPCEPSIRQKNSKPNDKTGENYTNLARGYAEQAKTSEDNAKTSELNAKKSEDNAKTHEESSLANANNSYSYSNQASESASKAKQYMEGAQEVFGNFDAIDDRITRNSKRITNLEQGIVPDPFETDDSIAYAKDVPEGALPYAEVSVVGGMTYKDEASGTLVDAKVTSLDIVGANLYSGGDVSYTRKKDVKLPYTLQPGMYTVSGILTSDETKYGYCLFTFKEGKGDENIIVTFKNGEHISRPVEILNPVSEISFTASGNANEATGYNGTAKQIMLNKGSTALPYAPYTKNTLSIPSTVQNGEGIDEDRYNHIQWKDNGKVMFNRMVKSYTVVRENVTKVTDFTYDNVDYFKVNKPTDALDRGNYGNNHLSAYGTTNANNYADPNNIGTMTGKAMPNDYWFGFAKGTTLEQAKAALDGFRIVYQLATTDVIDISHLISSDNFIGVEGGGTVFMKNENNLAVPSTITYQIKEDSV